MQKEIEIITKKKIERRKGTLPTPQSNQRIDEGQNSSIRRVLPTKSVKNLSIPSPKLSTYTKDRVQISLIQMKESFHSDILPPPKLMLCAESRLIFSKPIMVKLTDFESIRPPRVYMEKNSQLLLPFPLKYSIETFSLCNPPTLKYSLSIPSNRRRLSLREDVKITPAVELIDNINSMQSKPATVIQKTSIEKIEEESKFAGAYGNGNRDYRNIFSELFEWDDEPKKWDKFQSGINSKGSLCIFLIVIDDMITAELTITKLLSTEFKRKYGENDASHEIGDVSDSDKSVITFNPKQVNNFIEALKIRTSNKHSSLDIQKEDEYNKFNRLLNDLMAQTDFTRNSERKLLIFKCASESAITELHKEIKNKITNTHVLNPKYHDLSETNFKIIIKQILWVLSIPSYDTSRINNTGDMDHIFAKLDEKRLYSYNDFPHDEDWYKIRPSWGGEDDEHLKLKFLAYKQLKQQKYDDDEIKIEELFDNEGIEKSIPDLNIRGKIWVEIETLLGSTGLLYLHQEKFQKKQEQIMQHHEFWLILPNFEIFMHKNEVDSLLSQLYDSFDRKTTVKIFGCDFIERCLCLYRSKECKINRS